MVICALYLRWRRARLVGRFRCFLDQGRDLFWMREKDGVASGKLDGFRLGPATHESLELGIDHAILRGDYCIAGFLRPCRDGGLGVEDLRRDRNLRDGHELCERRGQVGGEVRGKSSGFTCTNPPPAGTTLLLAGGVLLCSPPATFADLRFKGSDVNQAANCGVSSPLQ